MSATLSQIAAFMKETRAAPSAVTVLAQRAGVFVVLVSTVISLRISHPREANLGDAGARLLERRAQGPPSSSPAKRSSPASPSRPQSRCQARPWRLRDELARRFRPLGGGHHTVPSLAQYV
jgi:hypothetical protein